MNLFRPVFRPESFDIVICNGVLHHTSDPFTGFQAISKLVKRGGFIVVGLYNKYGRILTHVRRMLFKNFGNHFRFGDLRLKERDLSEARRRIWFMDQYENPHESEHTAGEVLGWFDRTGFEFTSSIPKCTAFAPLSVGDRIFERSPRGTRLDHLLMQLGLLRNGNREGGLFIMVGRKEV